MMETASTNAEKFEWLQHWVAGENVQHLRTQVLTNGQTQKGKNGKLLENFGILKPETFFKTYSQTFPSKLVYLVYLVYLLVYLVYILVYQLLVVIFTTPLLNTFIIQFYLTTQNINIKYLSLINIKQK